MITSCKAKQCRKKRNKLFRHSDFCTAGNKANAIHSKSQTKLTRQLPIMWLPYLHHAQECTTMSWFCEKNRAFRGSRRSFQLPDMQETFLTSKNFVLLPHSQKTTSKRVKRYRTQMTTHNAGPSKPRFAEFAIQQNLFPRCLFRELQVPVRSRKYW